MEASSSNVAASGASRQTLLLAEINDHLSAIRTLKFQYNALAPVYTLPMEILARIFLEYSSGFVADDYIQRPSAMHPNSLPEGPGFYAWIVIAHVCAHWRSVAIATPVLWSRIFVGPLSFLPVMVLRSRTAPLDITVDTILRKYNHHDVKQAIAMIVEEFPRIRSLRLHEQAWSYFLQAIDPKLSRRPATVLRRLEVWGAHTNRSSVAKNSSWHDGEWVCDLQTLSITAIRFPWGASLPFGSLRHLEVHWSHRPSPSLVDVLHSLEQMQKLQTITIHLGLSLSASTFQASSGGPNVIGVRGTIQLPDLQSIRLILCDAKCCADILDHISFPAHTGITIGVSHVNETDLARLVRVIQEKVIGSGPLRTALLSQETSGVLRILATGGDVLGLPSPGILTGLRYALDVKLPLLNSALDIVCGSALFSQLKMLELSNVPYKRVEALGHLRNVEDLRIQAFRSERVGELLNHFPIAMGGRLIFPHLHMLSLDRVRFHGMVQPDSSSPNQAHQT